VDNISEEEERLAWEMKSEDVQDALVYDEELFEAGLEEDQHADMAVGKTNEDDVEEVSMLASMEDELDEEDVKQTKRKSTSTTNKCTIQGGTRFGAPTGLAMLDVSWTTLGQPGGVSRRSSRLH
jgi:hypothetical protein